MDFYSYMELVEFHVFHERPMEAPWGSIGVSLFFQSSMELLVGSRFFFFYSSMELFQCHVCQVPWAPHGESMEFVPKFHGSLVRFHGILVKVPWALSSIG